MNAKRTRPRFSSQWYCVARLWGTACNATCKVTSQRITVLSLFFCPVVDPTEVDQVMIQQKTKQLVDIVEQRNALVELLDQERKRYEILVKKQTNKQTLRKTQGLWLTKYRESSHWTDTIATRAGFLKARLA